MTVNLSALAGAGQQFFDDNGNPLTGGKLYSYAAGTTTPQATYTSADGVTANSNPIVLNAAGRVATGEIWVTALQVYKFVLYTSANVLIATWDNITGINGTGIATDAALVSYTPAGANAVVTTVQTKLRESVSVLDFIPTAEHSAIAAGTSTYDCTSNFNSALSINRSVLIPQGGYVVNGVVTIAEGTSLYSNSDFSDTSIKSSATPIKQSGSVLILGASSQFILSSNSSVSGVVVYYPTQNYSIVAGSDPDGLSSFVTFLPTFKLVAAYNSARLSNIVYIGGTTILYSPVTTNAEKLNVSNIVGCATGAAFDIRYTTDTIYFSDIHLNPNTVAALVTSAGGDFTNFCTKLAKNADSFSLTGCTTVNITNCFTFAVRNFILLTTGTGVAIVNSAADVCHTFIKCSGFAPNFGIQISNCWTTPIVYNPVISGAVSAITPSFVYIDSTGENYRITVNNCSTYGTTSGTVTDSNRCKRVYQVASGTTKKNHIIVNGCVHSEIQEALTSNISFFEHSVFYTVLTTKNTYLNDRIWGEKENVLQDGWGEQNGDLWIKSGVTSLQPNLGFDTGNGLRTSINAGGSLSIYTPYAQSTTEVQSFYFFVIDTYSAISSVTVTVDIYTVAGVYVSTFFTGPIEGMELRTDLVLPVAFPALNRLLKVTIGNGGGSAVDFSFACGFTAASPFPAIRPSPYNPQTFQYFNINNVSTTSPKLKYCTLMYSIAITADRTVTGNATNPTSGDTVRVVRTSASTGAFNVIVTGGATLTAGQWCDITYTGSAWVLAGYGTGV